MTLLLILKIIAVLGTIATGLFALLRPNASTGFIGLKPLGGRGITEIRTIFGALFIALGAAAYLYDAYIVLGIAYLAMAIVRSISIFIDHSNEKSNIISVTAEFLFGFILIF
ncbi:MAG: hypothetical protein JW750_02100 [Anaerolineaceae bacterium]|nr:hypothetical protein [Anaerolineaceae bacterium]